MSQAVNGSSSRCVTALTGGRCHIRSKVERGALRGRSRARAVHASKEHFASHIVDFQFHRFLRNAIAYQRAFLFWALRQPHQRPEANKSGGNRKWLKTPTCTRSANETTRRFPAGIISIPQASNAHAFETSGVARSFREGYSRPTYPSQIQLQLQLGSPSCYLTSQMRSL